MNKIMKTIIRLEELGIFLLGIYLYSLTGYQWWWFLVLILAPDLSMIGYLAGDNVGAFAYNLVHHRGIAIFIYLAGIYFGNHLLQLAGIILFSHSTMDRIFGYGLKYQAGFKFTHLGEIGIK
jgi:hypothetical protein